MYTSIIERVENSLKTLGIEAAQAKSDEGQYTISKDGDTEIMIDVWEQGGLVFFQVMAPVADVKDQNKEKLYSSLLEENHRLVESCGSQKQSHQKGKAMNWRIVGILKRSEILRQEQIR